MNPFILSAYHSPEYFCDREEEMHKLLSAVENNRNTTLISRRRMGKTGLLMHLRHKLKKRKDINFVYFDIMPTARDLEFVNRFADALFKSHRNPTDTLLKNFMKWFSAFRPSLSIDPVTGEPKVNLDISKVPEKEESLSAIMEYISKSRKKFVVAIDEFQQIANYRNENMEAMLRSHIQLMNNTAFIYSGSNREMLQNMFWNEKQPFYMSSDIMYLMPIAKDKYINFISSKFRKAGTRISKDVIEHILETVDINTYYVQLLCNRLYSEGIENITADKVDEMFLMILDEHKYYFENYRNILSDFQWRLLKAIAKDKKVTEITSKDFIGRHDLGSASSVGTAVKSLVKKEMLLKEEGKYMVHDVLFSEWLRKRG